MVLRFSGALRSDPWRTMAFCAGVVRRKTPRLRGFLNCAVSGSFPRALSWAHARFDPFADGDPEAVAAT